MPITIHTRELELSRTICDCAESFSAESDCIVPDSKPDILSVLQVNAHPYLTSREVQSSRVLLSGTVEFTIIYLADNAEKSVCAIRTAAAFSQPIACEGVTEDAIVLANCTLRGVTHSLLNCRKITVCAELCADLKVFATTQITVVDEIDGAQTQRQELHGTVIRAFAEKNFELTDHVQIPSGKQSIGELLRTSAKISECDLKLIQNKAIVKGSVALSLLYQAENSLEFCDFEIPFTEICDAPGVQSEMDVLHSLAVQSFTVSAAADADGLRRVLDIGLNLSFALIAREIETVLFISDAFCPHGNLLCNAESVFLSAMERKETDEIYVKELIHFPDGVPSIDLVYEVSATPNIESIWSEGRTLKVSGQLSVAVLYLGDRESAPVAQYVTTVPFSYATDAPDCSLKPVVETSVRHCTFTLQSDRAVELRAGVSLCIRCVRETNATAVCSAEEGDYTPPARPSVIVSFVSDTDSVWSIAKRYNISTDDLLRANALEEATLLTPGQTLIIPN